MSSCTEIGSAGELASGQQDGLADDHPSPARTRPRSRRTLGLWSRPRRQARDFVWALLVGATDVILRRYYGVREFTDDPSCLLRVSLSTASHHIELSDGTIIPPGEPVVLLHLWNEQIPPFSVVGPDFRWAIMLRRYLLQSLRALARHLDTNLEWRDLRAVHACVTFGSRRRRSQIRRAASRFGFELIEDGVPSGGLHAFGEDFLIWGLARAFNPAALRRQQFRRDRTELWISRARLLARYL